MVIESMRCECCGLIEDCTQDYISEVKSKFGGKWLCGLCSEAVKDGAKKVKKTPEVGEAVKAHMLFCRKDGSNPATRVADGMKQLLRRRSEIELHVSERKSSSFKKYVRSTSSSQVGDESSFPLF
ncbi:Protein of unknown function DUF1677, plant [Dillenia turbinata]|uniref:DUF1677 family protein n=1 Tax=Dillenia turbinata TaxID=194707 RepID=A0AAN8UEQ3_9MAGN